MQRCPRLTIDFQNVEGAGSRRRVFQDPIEILQANTIDAVSRVLQRVHSASRDGLYAAGFVAYEAAPCFDRVFRVRTGHRLPLAWFGLFAGDEPGSVEPQRTAATSLAPWVLGTTRAEYERAIHSIREAIAAGTVYQVNFTARLRSLFAGDPRAWYEQLRRAQGPGYHALLELGDYTILSISPELFFARRGNALVARPMKGTRPRGRWREEDRDMAVELQGSEKDRAELLMIVDLVRNDLGRIADFGTVRVDELYTLERYNTVWQMTSTVTARVAEHVTLSDIFRALFPCGSVTGAPKISAMNVIADLEGTPREVYCGAIGVIEPGGDCTFNVPIRTAWIDAEQVVEYGVGSGVTWDSAAQSEYDEVRAKSLIVSEPWPELELIETLLLRDGRFLRMPGHLDRLMRSAEYFGMSVDSETVVEAFARAAAAHPEGSWRVRLLAGRDVAPRVDAYPLEAPHMFPAPVRTSKTVVNSSSRFLFHKTSNRSVYEAALRGESDVFDVLLHNENGELTEFTRGNLVAELDGARVTPPVRCGLLPGVFRRELLESGAITERVLRMEDLSRCTRVWFVNSVREWVEVTWSTERPQPKR